VCVCVCVCECDDSQNLKFSGIITVSLNILVSRYRVYIVFHKKGDTILMVVYLLILNQFQNYFSG